MGNFQFLLPEFSAVFESASKAESLAIPDPRTACFYARRALELAVSWAYKFDSGLKLPYQDNISALIHKPAFKQAAGDAVFNKAKVIVTLGNQRFIIIDRSRKMIQRLQSKNCFMFAIGWLIPTDVAIVRLLD